MERGVPARLTAAEGRKFGLAVGGAFLVITAVLVWRHRIPAAYVTGTVGTLLFLAGLAIPAQLGPVYRAWMGLALAISKVTTPIVMGAIFFLVLTPSGLIARLLGHRPLEHERGSATYWKNRPEGSRRGEMNHQF
jgi:hypothetical protein